MPTLRNRLLARLLTAVCALALGAAITATIIPSTSHPPERIAAVGTPDRVDRARPANPSMLINVSALPNIAALTPPPDPPAPRPQKATVTAPQPAPPIASGDVEAAIATHFGPIADQASRVADCESSLDATAISPGGSNWGLFQINTVHRADFESVTGHPWAHVLNADLNAMYAKHLYDSEGWRPWACAWAA
jgi:hypothetical protein